MSVDDLVGGQLAAAHLLERGHRRLAAVGGRPDIPQVQQRRDGDSRAVLLGSPEAILLILPTDGLDISAGRTAAEAILAMPDEERPTGVFALNDLVAIGLLRLGQGLGCRAGGDQHRRLRRHRVRGRRLPFRCRA